MLILLFIIALIIFGMWIEYTYAPRIDIKQSHVYFESTISKTRQDSITGHVTTYVRSSTKLF